MIQIKLSLLKLSIILAEKNGEDRGKSMETESVIIESKEVQISLYNNLSNLPIYLKWTTFILSL